MRNPFVSQYEKKIAETPAKSRFAKFDFKTTGNNTKNTNFTTSEVQTKRVKSDMNTFLNTASNGIVVALIIHTSVSFLHTFPI